MQFDYGQTVVRERAKPILDPYSQEQIGEDWANPDKLTLDDAFVSSSTSTANTGEIREQVVTSKSLYLEEPDADVQLGDRIRTPGHLYVIEVLPEADVNPFTGWQPVREVPLVEDTG